MKILVSPDFAKKYKKFTLKDPKLSATIDKKFAQLQSDPDYPSLSLHKLSGKQDQWSISIKRNLRIIFQYVKEGIYVTDIGSHDEVY